MKELLVFPLLCVCHLSIAQQPHPAMEFPDGTAEYSDLVYSRVDGAALYMDLFVPPGEEKRPVVLWVHGGAWRGGSKENNRSALSLIDRGIAVARINYRLSGVAVWPAQIIDCKSAVRWLRAHADMYGLDPGRIGVWGASAGGHLVAMLGTSSEVNEWDQGDHLNHSSSVQAVCDWYGPTDFSRMDDRPHKMEHFPADSPESQLVGGPIREHPERVKDASPLTYVSGNEPPFLIMHGKEDPLVLFEQSILLFRALKSNNVSAELILIPDAGHGGALFKKEVDRVTQFFEQALKCPVSVFDSE